MKRSYTFHGDIDLTVIFVCALTVFGEISLHSCVNFVLCFDWDPYNCNLRWQMENLHGFSLYFWILTLSLSLSRTNVFNLHTHTYSLEGGPHLWRHRQLPFPVPHSLRTICTLCVRHWRGSEHQLKHETSCDDPLAHGERRFRTPSGWPSQHPGSALIISPKCHDVFAVLPFIISNSAFHFKRKKTWRRDFI